MALQRSRRRLSLAWERRQSRRSRRSSSLRSNRRWSSSSSSLGCMLCRQAPRLRRRHRNQRQRQRPHSQPRSLAVRLPARSPCALAAPPSSLSCQPCRPTSPTPQAAAAAAAAAATTRRQLGCGDDEDSLAAARQPGSPAAALVPAAQPEAVEVAVAVPAQRSRGSTPDLESLSEEHEGAQGSTPDLQGSAGLEAASSGLTGAPAGLPHGPAGLPAPAAQPEAPPLEGMTKQQLRHHRWLERQKALGSASPSVGLTPAPPLAAPQRQQQAAVPQREVTPDFDEVEEEEQAEQQQAQLQQAQQQQHAQQHQHQPARLDGAREQRDGGGSGSKRRQEGDRQSRGERSRSRDRRSSGKERHGSKEGRGASKDDSDRRRASGGGGRDERHGGSGRDERQGRRGDERHAPHRRSPEPIGKGDKRQRSRSAEREHGHSLHADDRSGKHSKRQRSVREGRKQRRAGLAVPGDAANCRSYSFESACYHCVPISRSPQRSRSRPDVLAAMALQQFVGQSQELALAAQLAITEEEREQRAKEVRLQQDGVRQGAGLAGCGWQRACRLRRVS